MVKYNILELTSASGGQMASKHVSKAVSVFLNRELTDSDILPHRDYMLVAGGERRGLVGGAKQLLCLVLVFAHQHAVYRRPGLA